MFSAMVVLTILFVILKLTSTIAWSWIWIVSPIWLYILLIIVLYAIQMLLIEWMYRPKKTKSRKVRW